MLRQPIRQCVDLGQSLLDRLLEVGGSFYADCEIPCLPQTSHPLPSLLYPRHKIGGDEWQLGEKYTDAVRKAIGLNYNRQSEGHSSTRTRPDHNPDLKKYIWKGNI